MTTIVQLMELANDRKDDVLLVNLGISGSTNWEPTPTNPYILANLWKRDDRHRHCGAITWWPSPLSDYDNVLLTLNNGVKAPTAFTLERTQTWKLAATWCCSRSHTNVAFIDECTPAVHVRRPWRFLSSWWANTETNIHITTAHRHTPSNKTKFKQAVILTGRNRTGPPWSVTDDDRGLRQTPATITNLALLHYE